MRLRSGTDTKWISSLREQILKWRNEQIEPQTQTQTQSKSRPRKRQCLEVTEIEEKQQLRRAPLTTKNLRQHTKIWQSETSGEQSLSETSETSHPGTTGFQFADKLQRRNILWRRNDLQQPDDYEMMIERLKRSRESDSPDSERFRQYREAVELAPNAASLGRNAIELLLKKPQPNHKNPYLRIFNHKWSDVGDISLAEGLSRPKPYYAESFRIRSYPLAARKALECCLQPGDGEYSTPRIAMELRDLNGNMVRANHQAQYVGAVATASFMEQEHYLGNHQVYWKTQAITLTTNGSVLGSYLHHVTKDGKYHGYPVFETIPISSQQEFNDTYRHVRNIQSWGHEKADQTLTRFQNHVEEEEEEEAEVEEDKEVEVVPKAKKPKVKNPKMKKPQPKAKKPQPKTKKPQPVTKTPQPKGKKPTGK